MRDGDAVRDEAGTAAADPREAAGEAVRESALAAGVADRLVPLLTKIMLGEERGSADDLPIRVLAWDGSAVGPAAAPAYVIRHRRALRRLLWKPGEVGFARAYIAGELDIEGDVFAALDAVQRVMDGGEPIRLSADDKRDIVRTAVTLGAVGPEPRPPEEEREVRDLGPMGEPAAFFARILGEGLAHGTGLWHGASDLDAPDLDARDLDARDLKAAQDAAHEAVAERLGLFPGARVLDLNCGWGAFALHAAARHGARVVGLARTPGQAEHVRAAAERSGADVEVRGWELPEPGDGPYDAIVGLADAAPLDRPAAPLAGLLAPGGRLVLQQPAGRPAPHRRRRSLATGYPFPDAAGPRPLGALVDELDGAGLEVRGVTVLREHHARTLRAWATRLQRHWTECAELAGPGRARVWLLHLAASALACDNGRIGRYEIRAKRTNSGGGGHHFAPAGPAVTAR
ncbi:cyclopropane-fatty-acyl-phospholipid synthase [Actinomadura hallensis]|uniref:Cyclopropane-fatty-acyl-phospholipid synthase n=1 Tax=Actinomadura hallensis TaxID=337895 RepID=A0A543IAH5_9ACTN|nr:class I SAM-dependent methyltransferase [Actinomadura hallensis]TQM67579.1 cyclopropane-fatty-acyl-phospholipid synthase [Actinomadura hallensis]